MGPSGVSGESLNPAKHPLINPPGAPRLQGGERWVAGACGLGGAARRIGRYYFLIGPPLPFPNPYLPETSSGLGGPETSLMGLGL